MAIKTVAQKKYVEKLKDPRWQKKRLGVFQRDNWTCQACMNTEHTLHVHHKWYERGKEPWDYDMVALITLCADCHEQETFKRKETEDYLLAALKENFVPVEELQDLAVAFASANWNEIPNDELREFIAAVSWLILYPEKRDELDTQYKEWLNKPRGAFKSPNKGDENE